MSLVKRTEKLPFIFEDLLHTDWFGGITSLPKINTAVATNILENDTAFTIELAAPGLKKEDFKIELDKDTLVISVDKNNDPKSEKTKYTRREYNFEKFTRAFKLPKTVETSEISAAYQNGVLSIGLPKKAEEKDPEKRMIAIA